MIDPPPGVTASVSGGRAWLTLAMVVVLGAAAIVGLVRRRDVA